MKFAFLTVVFAALIAGVAMLPATGKWRFVPGSLAAVALAILARFSILGNDDYYPAHMHYEVFVYPLVQGLDLEYTWGAMVRNRNMDFTRYCFALFGTS
jgi:hypothetical protein